MPPERTDTEGAYLNANRDVYNFGVQTGDSCFCLFRFRFFFFTGWTRESVRREDEKIFLKPVIILCRTAFVDVVNMMECQI